MLVNIEVIVVADRRVRPIAVHEVGAAQLSESRTVQLVDSARRLLPYRFITRLLRSTSRSAICSFSSAIEKQVTFRSRPRIQRCAISTSAAV
jgi:hypothetical protein